MRMMNILLVRLPLYSLNSLFNKISYFFFLEQLDVTTHKVHHKIFLASNHPLFSITLRPGFPKAIAVRNDVDCCLWLQQQITADDEWTLKHEG